jgi:hypothetical protein
MTNNDDPVNRRLEEVNKAGEAAYGESWGQAIRGLGWKMQNTDRLSSGAMSVNQQELMQKIASPTATREIFQAGVEGLLDRASSGDREAEAAYMTWRESLRDRKKWRDQNGR